MHNLRRIYNTIYVRFIIPKDRWADCGRREVLRTLQTTDLTEAHQRRGKALEAMRAAVNADLTDRGLPPLDSGWTPPWETEAVRARADLQRASAATDYNPETGEPEPWGSPRDKLKDRIQEKAEDLEARQGPDDHRDSRGGRTLRWVFPARLPFTSRWAAVSLARCSRRTDSVR
jgi:hypothetical protein